MAVDVARLYAFAKAGDLDRVEQLLPSATPLGLHNALFVSSRAGHVHVVEALVRHATPGIIHEALLVAAGSGKQPVVELLLTRAMPADATAALRGAAEGGHLETVQLLVAAGADITVEGSTAVALAEAKHHEGVVQYLVEHGADLAMGRASQSAIRFWLGLWKGLQRVLLIVGGLWVSFSPMLFVLRKRQDPKVAEPEEYIIIGLILLMGFCFLSLAALLFCVTVRIFFLRESKRAAAS